MNRFYLRKAVNRIFIAIIYAFLCSCSTQPFSYEQYEKSREIEKSECQSANFNNPNMVKPRRCLSGASNAGNVCLPEYY